MHQFMSKNLYMILFINGLSFFIPGFLILFQSLRLSKTFKYIKYIGLFFLFQGLADWGPLFYPIQSRIYSTQIMNLFYTFHIATLMLSFYCLATYGVFMLSRDYTKKFKLLFTQIPNIVLSLIIIISVYLLFFGDISTWFINIEPLIRYFLGLPATILTSIALSYERNSIKDNYQPKVGSYLKITSFTFLAYAIFSGIIVNDGGFIPANIINASTFFDFTSLPIEFFRAICGIIIAFCLIVILEIMEYDLHEKLEAAEKETLIFEERERISQDIHDGTMQALYGVGLRLQYIDVMLKDYPDEVVKEHLKYALQKLNQTSKEIRSYITNLRPQICDAKLDDEIKAIVRDFIAETNIQVRYDFDQTVEVEISQEIITQISFIIKEALNNIRKHADATMVQLVLLVFKDKIELVIRDNGKGFDCPNGRCPDKNNKGFGLKNMTKRVNDLKGSFNICSHTGAGTGISIIIPLEGK